MLDFRKGVDILAAVGGVSTIAEATPLHIGRSTQVWQIAIRDEQDKPICISRLTVAVR